MRDMNSITLCCVDCANRQLALRALRLSMAALPFTESLFITSIVENHPGLRVVCIDPINDHREYSRFMIKSLVNHINSSHVLVVQWDGYVVNPNAWTDEFLAYDYIGAPWEFHNDEYRVGNGGFSLRSKKLLEALQDTDITDFHPEDDAICRKYRPLLEKRYGIRFAPEELAKRFSFESIIPKKMPFGFHALHNMGAILAPEELPEFISELSPNIVQSNQYALLCKYYLKNSRYNEAVLSLRHRTTMFPSDKVAHTLFLRATKKSRLAWICEKLNDSLHFIANGK